MDKIICYNKNNIDLTYNLEKGTFYDDVSNTDVARYLKGVFSNVSRFRERFIKDFLKVSEAMEEFQCKKEMEDLIEIFKNVEPFTYAEAFKLENEPFRIQVFNSIDIGEMIENLGHTRIKVEGKMLKHKKFDADGNFLGYEEYEGIYETHEVNCEKLGLDTNAYVLKIWCTSTDKEHWLWIEDEFKDQPLEAVANTFKIHKNLIPHIKEIKRQGDVLLVELNDDVTPEGEIVGLTADQYFDLLTIQT
jgi:hypothetical protein